MVQIIWSINPNRIDLDEKSGPNWLASYRENLDGPVQFACPNKIIIQKISRKYTRNQLINKTKTEEKLTRWFKQRSRNRTSRRAVVPQSGPDLICFQKKFYNLDSPTLSRFKISIRIQYELTASIRTNFNFLHC